MSGSVKLNRALDLQSAVLTDDGAGGTRSSWTSLGTLWAEVRPGTGRETDRDSLPVASTRLRIIVRVAPVGAPSRPRPDQRFVEGQRIYNVMSVAEMSTDQKYLVCHAVEEVIQ